MFFSDCDCDEDKKKTETTDLQVVTPTASSSSSLHRTERPASTQNTAASPTNNFIASNAPFTHTESRADIFSGYITSADAPEFNPTTDPFLTTNKEPSMSTTTSTTTASKVIRGRIPWNRLFGGRQREEILGRRRKPFITTKTSTTAETTTVTSTTTPAAMPTTTANSLTEPETLYPSRHTESKESSLDDGYGDLFSADFELTTVGPSIQHLTTTNPSYYSRSFTTAETPPESQTLPSPPTVKPLSIENPDEAVSSGSGGLPDNWFVIRQRPGGTRGQQGRRRKPFRGRRPLKKPTFTKLYPTSTTEALTTEVTTTEITMETSMETTIIPQRTVSVSKPLYTPSRTADRTMLTVSAEDISEQETYSYEEVDWSRFTSSSSAYTPTNTPLIPSTTFMPTTSKGPYTTAQNRVQSNIRPPTQKNNGPTTHRTPTRRIKPTVQDNGARGVSDKGLTFDTMTILTAEQGYTNTPAPYNKDIHNAIPSVYNHVTGFETTGANIAGFQPTTKVMTSKPKIVGGNAASFTVLSNSDAFLPCEAVGNPQPTITWKRFSSSAGTKTISLIVTMEKNKTSTKISGVG